VIVKVTALDWERYAEPLGDAANELNFSQRAQYS
jgi:hypothetical protein